MQPGPSSTEERLDVLVQLINCEAELIMGLLCPDCKYTACAKRLWPRYVEATLVAPVSSLFPHVPHIFFDKARLKPQGF